MKNKKIDILIMLVILAAAVVIGVYLLRTPAKNVAEDNTELQSEQEDETATPVKPQIISISAEKMEIADSVNLVNLFNPSVVGKENMGYSIAYLDMEKDSIIPLRTLSSNEIEYFISGEGKIIINGETFEVKPGDAIFMPKNSIQETHNVGDGNLQFLAIVEPAWTPEAEKRIEQ